jgi:hypothetical protein
MTSRFAGALACHGFLGIAVGCITDGIFSRSSRRLFGKPSLPGTVIPPLPWAADSERTAHSVTA